MKLHKLFLLGILCIVLTLTLTLSACSPPLTTTPKAKPEAPKEPEVSQPQVSEKKLPDSDVVPWNKASDYIGERVTVYGPVVSTHYASTSRGRPTFLNVGKLYPDPDRFTVVIWGKNRDNFDTQPEDYYEGKTIYVTGLVIEYKGVPEIEVESPDQIEER